MKRPQSVSIVHLFREHYVYSCPSSVRFCTLCNTDQSGHQSHIRLRVTSIDTLGQQLEQIGVNGDKYVWHQKHLDHRKTPKSRPQTLTRLGVDEQPVTEPAKQRGANRNTCQNTGGQTGLARAPGDEF